MSELPDRVLPEGAEWATAPLLDPANVGRYVWAVWDGNYGQGRPRPIVKITRSHVHLDGDGRAPWVLRQGLSGATASGYTRSGYMLSAHTEEWRVERIERQKLWRRLDDAMCGTLPVEVLRRLVAVLDDAMPLDNPTRVG